MYYAHVLTELLVRTLVLAELLERTLGILLV